MDKPVNRPAKVLVDMSDLEKIKDAMVAASDFFMSATR